MSIRPAKEADLPAILEIYAYARAQMRANGNPNQWGSDRPPLAAIKADIRLSRSYVLEKGGKIEGVFAFFIGDDPTYSVIEDGAWRSDAPYGVIHRIARGENGQGLLALALEFAERQISHLRIDTHADNKIMQHLLEKYGFFKCGRIYTDDGTARIAYERIR